MQLCQTHKEHIEHRLSKNTQKQENLENRKRRSRIVGRMQSGRNKRWPSRLRRSGHYVMLHRSKCLRQVTKSCNNMPKFATKNAANFQKLPMFATCCQKQPKIAKSGQKLPLSHLRHFHAFGTFGQYGSSWVRLGQAGPVQTSLGQSWSVMVSLGQSWSVLVNLGQAGLNSHLMWRLPSGPKISSVQTLKVIAVP